MRLPWKRSTPPPPPPPAPELLDAVKATNRVTAQLERLAEEYRRSNDLREARHT